MPDAWDFVVVGGGPAGATAAALLAAAGFKVLLCEGKSFPREKVCGEFMGTKIRPVLARLGLLEQYDQRAGPSIKRVAAYPPATSPAEILTGPMPPDKNGAFPRALARGELDHMLLTRARQLGAHIRQPCRVLSTAGNAPAGFLVKTTAGQFHARAVILAHGLAQRGALDDTQIPPPLRRQYVSFKTHLTHCDLAPETIAIAGAAGLYAGLVQSSQNRYSLAFVVRRERSLRLGNAPEAHLAALRSENPGFARLLKPARRAGPWMASGPLEPGVRTLYKDGRFFVGNAAGEVHALIGEGITLALRGAEILADILCRKGPLSQAGRDYDRLWRKEFAWRYAAAQVFANTLMRPSLSALSATVLNAYPELFAACIRRSGK